MATPQVYLVSAARTPVGSFLGALADVPAPHLGSVAIQGALGRTGIEPSAVNEVFMGCVLSAGQGQAPARQAMIKAGLPTMVGATTVNKVCGSGLKAVTLGWAQIIAGEADLVLAGGMESMSQVPYYLMNARNGFRMGHQTVTDGMIYDGLWDPYQNFHMGNAGELCAAKYQFSKQAQDDYALASYQRALRAIESGAFKREIEPVHVPQRKGDPVVVDQDEEPFKANLEKLPSLKPAFQKEGGTITAGNASSINDGAAALLLASEVAVQQFNLKPMARIVGTATHSQAPEWFTTAPVGAIEKLTQKLKVSVDTIDLFEVNEAFAVVPMAVMSDLSIPHEKINVRGSGISLGHPIGASGARILVTLLHALADMKCKRGLATLCNGGGEAVALLVECV